MLLLLAAHAPRRPLMLSLVEKNRIAIISFSGLRSLKWCPLVFVSIIGAGGIIWGTFPLESFDVTILSWSLTANTLEGEFEFEFEFEFKFEFEFDFAAVGDGGAGFKDTGAGSGEDECFSFVSFPLVAGRAVDVTVGAGFLTTLAAGLGGKG